MKYAVIGDIHGNLEALNAVILRAEANGADRYICVGDVVGYNANPAECLEILQSLDLLANVQGNNDEYVGNDVEFSSVNKFAADSILWTKQQLTATQREWLNNLKLIEVVDEDNLTVVHATLDSPAAWGYVYDEYLAKDNFLYQSTQVCFCGHTHVPVLFKKGFSVENNTFGVFEVPEWSEISDYESEVTVSIDFGCKYLINAGSVGQPRNKDPRASFCMYDTEKRTLKRVCVEYDIESAQEKIRKAGLPEVLALRLERGR